MRTDLPVSASGGRFTGAGCRALIRAVVTCGHFPSRVLILDGVGRDVLGLCAFQAPAVHRQLSLMGKL